MRSAILVVLVVTLLLGASTGCCWRANSSSSTETAGCTCPEGKSGDTTWCHGCKVGYVGGEKVHCGGCYTAKNGGPACQACASKAGW